MAQPYKFLRVSVVVFKVLAWVSAVLLVGVGLYLVVAGGEPILVANVDVPARVVGILNFVTAAMYFFSFRLMSAVIAVLLDIRGRLPNGSSP